MTTPEIEFMLRSFPEIYEMFMKAVTKLKKGSEQLVLRNDKEAYEKLGIKRGYWERIKYRVPYVAIPPEKEGGEEIRVYPIKSLDAWVEQNTVYPEGKK
ncbi:hypothetical protein ACRHK7_01280 [Weissella tructae]|uniref:hypothetical protein n=1 Tax=Weissella tructae TaxID=887702 RepID=UPI003D8F2413